MQRTYITGTTLFYLIQALFAIWIMVSAFGNPPNWFHLIGVLAIALFIFRIVRGDD